MTGGSLALKRVRSGLFRDLRCCRGMIRLQCRQAVISSNKYDEFIGLFPTSINPASAAFIVTDFNYMPLSSIAYSLKGLSDAAKGTTTVYSRAI